MKAKLFDSEQEMQEWLRLAFSQDNDFSSLIVNGEYIEALKPTGFIERKFATSYRMAWRALQYVEVLTDNQNIALMKGEVLRPDFMLYGQESQTIAVVELKNLPNTTREAGTEFGAYAAAIRSYLPFLADGDVISVLISTDWPTLLRHFVRNEILWLGRTVICLEPIRRGRKFALEIKGIDHFLQTESSVKFSADTVGGLCLSLHDYGRQGLDRHVMQMRAAGAAMASQGSALKSHGFAFLWKDHRSDIPAPYCFTIANIASFQTLTRLLVGPPPYKTVNRTHKKLLEIVRNFDPQGHGVSLHEIARRGREFLQSCSSPQIEFGTDWANLKTDINENSEKMMGFYPWGFFAEAFHEHLKAEYDRGNHNVAPDCPRIGWKVVEELVADLTE